MNELSAHAHSPVIQYHGVRRSFLEVVNDVRRYLFFADRDVRAFIAGSGSLSPPRTVLGELLACLRRLAPLFGHPR